MRKRFPKTRKVLLLLGDVFFIVFSIVLAVFTLHYLQIYKDIPYMTYINMSPVIIVAALIIFNTNGLFSLARKTFSEVFMSLVVSQFQLLLVTMAASFLFREFAYSRMVLLFSFLLQFILLVFWKYSFWSAERMLVEPKAVLLLGNEASCRRVLLSLHAQPQLRYKVKYACTKEENIQDWQAAADLVDLIIICDGIDLKSKAEIVHFGHTNSKQVFIVPSAYDLFCNGAVLDKIDDIPVFRPRYLKPTSEQRALKRTLDIVVSSLALLMLTPIFLIVAVAIKIDSSGPIFYRQKRLGRKEKAFYIYKFRSMNVDAETATGPVMALENDPRITKLGRLLRRTRIDEFPQLINVLRGEMSIVGPRPERPFFVEKFKKEIPEYVYRHNIKPGITGLAQIYGKYNTPAYDKLVYDLIYIQSFSVLEDVRIMLKTVRVLLDKKSVEGIIEQTEPIYFEKYHVGVKAENIDSNRV